MNPQVLKQKLEAIDGHDYGAYQSLLGAYQYDLFRLVIDQIPKDPYAPPHTGIYRVQLNRNDTRVAALSTRSKIASVATRDFLARRFSKACQKYCRRNRGTGFSGVISVDSPGQAILERTSVVITDQIVEVRCFLGLPAQGRKVVADTARQMFFEELPTIVDDAMHRDYFNTGLLEDHIAVAEDAEFLRERLETLGLIAFVADDSILPRLSGNSDLPMTAETAVPFRSPDSLAIEVTLPHAGTIRGMGVPKGVTLITGGGYHGKSTLLNALELGIYNHIPGDGRERCVSLSEAVKVRAASGRSVVKTDISPFIQNLPFGQDTRAFTTLNASGSTSQAANIVEAIEVGARVILMDEDTCATNFMIRDAKMQQLVQREDEPIISFIDQVRQMYRDAGISTILVLGGIGDYFSVSDRVIQVVNYQPRDVTTRAHQIANSHPGRRQMESRDAFQTIQERMPQANSIDPRNNYGKFSIFVKELHRVNFGRQTIDLTDLEQLMEISQVKALAFAIDYAKKYMNGWTVLKDVVRQVADDIENRGLDVLTKRMTGDFARFRPMELAFALNRLRSLKVNTKAPPGEW